MSAAIRGKTVDQYTRTAWRKIYGRSPEEVQYTGVLSSGQVKHHQAVIKDLGEYYQVVILESFGSFKLYREVSA